MYNIVDQLISSSDIKGSGRTVVLDSAYVTILLFRAAATVWKTKMVSTIGKQLKHLFSRFSDMKSNSKRWMCGFSQSLHNEELNITFSNDNNDVVFLDNDLESTRENWKQIETQSGESRLSVYAPLVVPIYREHYGMVDRSNQAGLYHRIDRKNVCKQNRILFYDSNKSAYNLSK